MRTWRSSVGKPIDTCYTIRHLIISLRTSYPSKAFGDRKPFPLDGRWIAYQSRENGRVQLYVMDFPSAGSKWQVTALDISDFRWRADGKELLFIAQDGNVMAAAIAESGGSFTVTGTRTVFRTPFANGRLGAIFDVERTRDGRFLGEVAPDGSALSLNVVTNWTELMKKD